MSSTGMPTSHRRVLATAIVLLLGSALGACGATRGSTRDGRGATEQTARRGPSALELARRSAREHPEDIAAMRALLEHELLAPGGDPREAERVLTALAAADDGDLRTAYLAGLLHEQHGRADGAVDAFVAAMRLSLTSTDPWAPFIARSALAYVGDVEVDATRFDERVAPAVQALFDRADGPFAVRRAAFHWLYDAAMRAGDPDRARGFARAMGCPTEARLAGPFSLRVLGAFDTALPAEGPGPMAASYDLGPGRGNGETRELEAHGCVLDVAGDSRATRGAGTRVLEATLEAPTAGRYVLALDSEASLRATIDGREVVVIDRRRAEHPLVVEVEVELAAGPHELELRLASRAVSHRLAWNFGRGSVARTPSASAPLERFLVLETRTLDGRAISAREGLRHVMTDDATSAVLILAARIVRQDPFASGTQQEDDERRLVRRAVERDPDALVPAHRLAGLEPNQTERLAALRAVRARFPEALSVELHLHDELREAGLTAEARESLARAAALRPASCPVLGRRFDDLSGRDHDAEARALLPALLACDAREEAALESAAARRDWATVDAELTRLSRFWSPEAHRESSLRLSRARGDTATERRLEAETEADAAEDRLVVVRADRRYEAGDRAGALALLDHEAARAPDEAHDLRRIMMALSGRDVMEPYRRDGLAVIREFEASGRRYDGYPAVLLWDYMVTRVLPTGASIDLVHQIFRVQTQEGIERFAELTLNGRVLLARVVRADGTVREPDRIAQQTAMPPLSVGDYVEYEIVRERAPSWGDAYLSDGWVFQDFQQPFDHSEMVFVAPPDLELVFDARGPVPPPTVTVEDGLRVHRFLMTRSLPLTQEPDSIADPPILPSLRAGVRVTWDRMLGAFADMLLDTDVPDPAAARLLEQEIRAGADVPAATRVQRIHRWVVENVEPADGAFFAQAGAMVAARSGHRARVLRYLLELAGIPAVIAISRDLTGERPGPVPDADVYGQFVVGADVEGQRLWMLTGARGMAHSVLSPNLTGQEAVVLVPTLPRVTLPASQGPASRRTIEAYVDVSPQGVATLAVTFTLSGLEAGGTRRAIEEIPEGERQRLLAERFVPSIVPGARADVASLVIRGLDDWEAPLVISFRAQSAALFARDGEAQRVRMIPMFASDLEEQFAQLPTRTTTALTGGVDSDVILHIRGPGVLRPPPNRSVRGPSQGSGALVESTIARDGTITTRRRVRLPLGLTRASEYPALVQFCRAASEIERSGITISAR